MSQNETVPVTQPLKPPPVPKMDPYHAPPWWLTQPKEIRDFLESLDGVRVAEIGKTAGGRTIIAAEWGEREMLPGATCDSLAAAIGAGDTAVFYGKGERKRQVFLFLGAAHGTEYEGTVAALNYLNIIVTGKDLLGREQPQMAEEGRQHRFLIIPILNVDGRERALDHRHFIGVDPDYFGMITQGMFQDGRVLHWPESKLYQPMTRDRFKLFGTYVNDAGVNLVYDSPFASGCQPETDALIRYCRREMPDCVMLSHSNNGSLVCEPSSYIPAHYKQRVAQISAVVGMRCRRAGFAKFGIPQSATSYAGEMFYQTDAVHHACGALPVMVEFPEGWQNLPDNHKDILDIGLAVIDEVCAFGNRYRFRPRDPKRK
jgi:hypothetical protein